MESQEKGWDLQGVGDVFDLAITAEMDAHRFYLSAGDQMKDGKARATFLALAADEGGHRLQLEQEYRHLLGERPFQYRPGTNSLHRYLNAELNDLEAIALGIRGEKAAIRFYEQAEAHAKDSGLKRVLHGLVEFEEGHRRLLESEYQARLGRPWDDLELGLWVRE